ncbi:hypothetical protein V6N13_132833 [Hibiscus sabdariffa]
MNALYQSLDKGGVSMLESPTGYQKLSKQPKASKKINPIKKKDLRLSIVHKFFMENVLGILHSTGFDGSNPRITLWKIKQGSSHGESESSSKLLPNRIFQ